MKFKTTSSFFFLLILYRFFSLPSPTMLSILLLITLYTIVGPTILSSVPLFLFALSCFPCIAFANQRPLTYLTFPFLSLSLYFSLFPKVSDPNKMAHRAEFSSSWVSSSPLNSLLTFFPPLISRIQCLIFLFGGGWDFRKSRKKSPNRLVIDEAINDDNSVVAMHPETMKKLHFFRGDTILINVSDLREFCVLFWIWFLKFLFVSLLWIYFVRFVLWVWCHVIKLYFQVW